MTIIVRSIYNFVNRLQFNIRYEKVERPAPVGGALVFINHIEQIVKDMIWLVNNLALGLCNATNEIIHEYKGFQINID